MIRYRQLSSSRWFLSQIINDPQQSFPSNTISVFEKVPTPFRNNYLPFPVGTAAVHCENDDRQTLKGQIVKLAIMKQITMSSRCHPIPSHHAACHRHPVLHAVYFSKTNWNIYQIECPLDWAKRHSIYLSPVRSIVPKKWEYRQSTLFGWSRRNPNGNRSTKESVTLVVTAGEAS